LEILERAKGNAGEIVPFNADEKDLREEVNRRTYKAGYTNREGGPAKSGRIISMPANDKYRENYVKIFGHN